jgi:Spy/CpxP family protein refolding chaperone
MGRAIALFAFALTLLLASENVETQRLQWWLDPNTRRDLALTDEQTRALDSVFHEDLAARRAVRTSLQAAEAAFDRALAAADEPEAVALAERVAELKARQNTARTKLLLRMSWVLTRDQRAKLRDIRQRRGPRGADGNPRVR